MKFLYFLPTILLLSACTNDPEPAEPEKFLINDLEIAEPITNTQQEKASELIWREVKPISIGHSNDKKIQWQIYVKDNGTRRYGLAEYVCLLLNEAGVDITDQRVAILNEALSDIYLDDIEEYSLGIIECYDGYRFD